MGLTSIADMECKPDIRFVELSDKKIHRTECGVLSHAEEFPEPRKNGEWRYMRFRRSGYNYHLIPTGEPSRAQLVICVRMVSTYSRVLALN